MALVLIRDSPSRLQRSARAASVLLHSTSAGVAVARNRSISRRFRFSGRFSIGFSIGFSIHFFQYFSEDS